MFNSDTDSDVETYQKSSTPINTVAEIRREQDKEYMASLEADQKKNEERKKKNHLKEKQELRLRTLKPEPSLRENCLPVIVQHIFLEKKAKTLSCFRNNGDGLYMDWKFGSRAGTVPPSNWGSISNA